MADHDGVVPRHPGGGATVTDVVLDVVDDNTLRDSSERGVATIVVLRVEMVSRCNRLIYGEPSCELFYVFMNTSVPFCDEITL